MKDKIVKGDMVKHIFNNFKYKVLEVRDSRPFLDELKHQFGSDEPFKNLLCLCDNGNTGWLSDEEVEKL